SVLVIVFLLVSFFLPPISFSFPLPVLLAHEARFCCPLAVQFALSSLISFLVKFLIYFLMIPIVPALQRAWIHVVESLFSVVAHHFSLVLFASTVKIGRAHV